MNKIGNNHSSLMDEIVKIANAEDTPKPASPTFQEIVAADFARKPEPTLREILAQFDPVAKPMDVSDGLDGGGMPGELPGEEDPLSDVPGEFPGGEGDLAGEDPVEKAKTSAAQLLVDLHDGDADQAKAAIDSCCGSLDGELGGGDLGGDELPPIGEEVDGLDEAPPEPMLGGGAPPAPMQMGY